MTDPITAALVFGLVALSVALAAWAGIRDYQRSPACKWCRSRYRGRCVFSPPCHVYAALADQVDAGQQATQDEWLAKRAARWG